MTLSVAISHRLAGFTLDAAFDAPPGVTVLFGRSGSGKTTIANAVAGLFRPDSGRIVADELVMMDSAEGIFLPPHRRGIGYVFQEGRLFPHLTVRQNLQYGRWFARRKSTPQEFDRIVGMLGIGPFPTEDQVDAGDRFGHCLIFFPRFVTDRDNDVGPFHRA